MFSACYWVFKIIFYIIFKLYNRLEVRNPEGIPKSGGVLVVANHASYLDPPVVGLAVPRRATFMAKESLFALPFPIGEFVSSFAFPINRDNPKPSQIKETIERLKKGQLVIMFPQGGRRLNPEDFELKRGVELIARLSGALVVPAFIRGTDRALPIGAFLPRPVKIKVGFGAPIEVKEGSDLREEVREAFKRLSKEIT